MLGVDAWVVFGVLLVGGYAYWVYTDLIRPRLADDEPYDYEWAESAEDAGEPSDPDRATAPDEDG